MNNIKTADWHALNKCNRMVDVYIADMNKCLSCSEWPDSSPEPKYLNTLKKYLDLITKLVGLKKTKYHDEMLTIEYKYIINSAKQQYLAITIYKLSNYLKDIGK